jgi:hypothetical protein
MLKQWHKRYWILTAKYFKYWYSHEECQAQADKPKAVISLASIRDINEDANGMITIQFEQGNGETQLTNLRMSSAIEAQQWARVLREAVKMLHDVTAAPEKAAPPKKSVMKCETEGCERWKISGQKYCKDHNQGGHTGARQGTTDGAAPKMVLGVAAAAPMQKKSVKNVGKCETDGCDRWKISGQKCCKDHQGTVGGQLNTPTFTPSSAASTSRPRGYTHVQSARSARNTSAACTSLTLYLPRQVFCGRLCRVVQYGRGGRWPDVQDVH